MRKINGSFIKATKEKLDGCALKEAFEQAEDFSQLIGNRLTETARMYKDEINKAYKEIKTRLKAKLQQELEKFNSDLSHQAKVLIGNHASGYAKLRHGYRRIVDKLKVLEQANSSADADHCSSYIKLMEADKELTHALQQGKALKAKLRSVFGLLNPVDVDIEQILSAVRFKAEVPNPADKTSTEAETGNDTRKSGIIATLGDIRAIEDTVSPINKRHTLDDRQQVSFQSYYTALKPFIFTQGQDRQPGLQGGQPVMCYQTQGFKTTGLYSSRQDYNQTRGLNTSELQSSLPRYPTEYSLDTQYKSSSRPGSMTNKLGKPKSKPQTPAIRNQNIRGASLNVPLSCNPPKVPKTPNTAKSGTTAWVNSQVFTEDSLKKLLSSKFCGKCGILELVLRKNVFECDPLAVLAAFFDRPQKEFVCIDMQNNRFDVGLRTQLSNKKKLLYNKVKVLL